jgi:hypothetical protein
MGPSGAGKSTLMDVLAMRKSTGHVLGAVLVDGAPANSTWLRRTAYVPQQDNFIPVMTAHEVGGWGWGWEGWGGIIPVMTAHELGGGGKGGGAVPHGPGHDGARGGLEGALAGQGKGRQEVWGRAGAAAGRGRPRAAGAGASWLTST